MDTIVRGKPIPKVFIRQFINPKTQKSVREVVDGQQRLRTILSFIDDGFVISKRHNKEFGGLKFSEIADTFPEVHSSLLNYEISLDLLVNLSDGEILDVFSRLNSYAVTLNVQEKINAEFFGPFKVLSDNLAHKHNKFWVDNKIISPQQNLRMHDVMLVADLLIAMVDGIKSKKQIKLYYEKFEKNFPMDEDRLEVEFDQTMSVIQDMFGEEIKTTEFTRVHIFYTLFTSVYHCLFGLPDMNVGRPEFDARQYSAVRNALDKVNELFSTEDVRMLETEEAQFLEDSRRATTDAPVRARRTAYILSLIRSAV
jgi:hypothetical protein